MKIDKTKVKKILVVSLSNIGDIILTFPVLDILRNDFPDAKISVIVGPKGEGLLKGNPHFEKIYIYHKRQPVKKMLAWMWELHQERFDMAIDLRNTAIPLFAGARYRTALILKRDLSLHVRHQHLNRLRSVHVFDGRARSRYALFVSPKDRDYIDGFLTNMPASRLIVVSPGAADEKKRWMEKGFARVCDALIKEDGAGVVFVGDVADKEGIRRIMAIMNEKAFDLSGRASLTQVAHLMSRSRLVLSNDSAPMHLASYLDIPVVALFGPTSPERYGPWSSRGVYIKKAAASATPDSEHIKLIAPDEVLQAARKLLGQNAAV